ncbi:MAG: hypothetical protein DCF16_11670 [Alphaproteobacteria bacterium]|nr:MAG: hypothetical protein DCF16_11670 [Alphaproteobacteria bacterium]
MGLFEIEGGSDATSIGINGEYQFAAMPISVYGGYSTTDFDGVDAETLSIGVRHNFGGTLFDRDRSGAGLVRNAGFGRLGAIF